VPFTFKFVTPGISQYSSTQVLDGIIDDLLYKYGDLSDTTWAEVASKHVDVKLGQVAAEVQEVHKALQETREAAIEEQDRESRKCNIVLYRVPESLVTLYSIREKFGGQKVLRAIIVWA